MKALPFLLLLLSVPVFSQGTQADYDRAAGLSRRWRGKLRPFRPRLRWLPDGGGVAWKEGQRFVVIDGKTGARRLVDELPSAKGPSTLRPKRTWGASPSRNGAECTITFENRLDRTIRLFWVDADGRPRQYGTLAPGTTREQHTYGGHVWLGDFAKDDLAGIFVAEDFGGTAIFNTASRRATTAKKPPKERTRREARVYVQDHDVWMKDARGTTRLTTGGKEGDALRQPRHWSPNDRYVLGFQVADGERRRIPLVESSPKDQVQPKLQWRNYTKPGDRIDAPRPRLFDLRERKLIRVDEEPFEDAWRVGNVHWSKDSRRVYCLYNRRGHQQLAVRCIDARTGKVTTIVDEKSETFVDYSQKTFLHWLDDDDQLLWMSERDGWNHLYRFDARRGRLVNQVTKGKWVVRKVERVDVEKRQIWFTALGIHPDQDPYHEHLARVDFDGKNLTVLTKSDGTHDWEFSPDGQFLLATWSRVDHPKVTELRRTKDGSLVAELGRDDAQRLLAAGFRPPERFVAKGRDGKTDIHGFIIRPANFDPNERYPVIEDIYAGPHGHHVPKSWHTGLRQRILAELGFIVVRIDGMGTNWRSKAFHDVCWRNLKDGGFPDRIAWMRAAAKKYPELDLDRVGIFGGSAGGQNALAALLHHGDFYDVAVSDCGCHDNRMDKIWWNEAWMGVMGPHYAENSNVTHAHKLKGKLFLTVGELDTNVDPASTMQVVNALIRANKDFDMIVVPGAGHGVGESRYLVRRRQDFFVRHLLGFEPRRP